jgi:hypothetical protein
VAVDRVPLASRAARCVSTSSPATYRRGAKAWTDTALTRDATIRAFWEQLQRVKSQPKIPEWELISIRLMEKSELAIRGKASGDSRARDPRS